MHVVQAVLRDRVVGEERRDPSHPRLLPIHAHGGADGAPSTVDEHLGVASGVGQGRVRPDRMPVVMDIPGLSIADGLRGALPEPVGIEPELVAKRPGVQGGVEAAADGVRRGRQVDANGKRGRPLVIPGRGRLVVVVHQVILEVRIRTPGDLRQNSLRRRMRELQRVRLRLEEGGVEQTSRIVDVVLPLEAAAVLEERPPAQTSPEVPARIERLVVSLHRVAAAVGVVASDPGVVLERESHAVGAAVQAGESVVGAPVAAVVVAGAAAEPEIARAERRLEGLGLDRAERAGAPGERIRPPHHTERLQRVRADVAQRRVHARGARRERAGAVDEHPDLLGVEAPDRRVEIDGAAPQRGHPRMAAERLRQILCDATFDLGRRAHELGGHLRHQGAYPHLLRERADLQRDCDELGSAGTHRDRPDVPPEPEQVRRHDVFSGRDAVDGERACPVGRHRGDEVTARRTELHRRTRQRQPLGVRHCSSDGSTALGVQMRRRDQPRQQQRRARAAQPRIQLSVYSCCHDLPPRELSSHVSHRPGLRGTEGGQRRTDTKRMEPRDEPASGARRRGRGGADERGSGVAELRNALETTRNGRPLEHIRSESGETQQSDERVVERAAADHAGQVLRCVRIPIATRGPLHRTHRTMFAPFAAGGHGGPVRNHDRLTAESHRQHRQGGELPGNHGGDGAGAKGATRADGYSWVPHPIITVLRSRPRRITGRPRAARRAGAPGPCPGFPIRCWRPTGQAGPRSPASSGTGRTAWIPRPAGTPCAP